MVIMSSVIYNTFLPDSRLQSTDSLSRSPPSPNDRLHSRARTTFRFSNSEIQIPNLHPLLIFFLILIQPPSSSTAANGALTTLRPILHLKSGHSLKLSPVMSHQCGGQRQGMGGNQQIHRPDRTPCLLQHGSNLPICLGSILPEGQVFEGEKKLGQSRPVLLSAGAVFHSIPQFRSGDGGEGDRAGLLPCQPPGDFGIFPVDEINAVIGIEQVHQIPMGALFSSSGCLRCDMKPGENSRQASNRVSQEPLWGNNTRAGPTL